LRKKIARLIRDFSGSRQGLSIGPKRKKVDLAFHNPMKEEVLGILKKRRD